MRVVSKHLDGREEDELTDLPEIRPEHLPTSAQAQLQARLGHQIQKLPIGGAYRTQPPVQLYSPHLTVGPGGQSTVTDWRAQSHLSRGGDPSELIGAAPRPGTLDQTPYHFVMPGAEDVSAVSESSLTCHIPGSKIFSREGIQQTIDNVRNRWFKTDNVLVSGPGRSREEVDGVSYRLHGHDQVAGTTTTTTTRPVQDSVQPSSQGQSSSLSTSHSKPSRYATPPIPIPSREAAPSTSDSEYQEYDSSLDKLNSSLTELQGEIMRMSLQQEQVKTTHSPVNGHPDGFIPGIMRHTVGSAPVSSHAAVYESPHQVGVRQRQQPPTTLTVPHKSYTAVKDDSDVVAGMENVQHSLSDNYHHYAEADVTQDHPRQHVDDSEVPSGTPADGFFVSFGDKATPVRPKPVLSEHQDRGLSQSRSTGEAPVSHGGIVTSVSGASNLTNDVMATLAGQAMLEKKEMPLTDLSPKVGFIIKDETAIAKDNVSLF